MYVGVILPSGNSDDFYWLINSLNKRGVQGEYRTQERPAFMLRLPVSEINKLPSDEKGYYLGDERRGFSFYPMDNEQTEPLEDSYGKWKPIAQFSQEIFNNEN